jgi:hypothetical protein
MLDRHPQLRSVGATRPEQTTEDEPNTGYRFSWGLAFVGGVAATAITFFLLTLGSGLGLMLVKPLSGTTSAASGFLTGGAIYFFVAQAFGFAVGGHLAGRLMGPLVETDTQEMFRTVAHGLMSWCIAILATVTMIGLVGASVAGNGATVAALYTFQAPNAENPAQVAYLVDILFRPEESASPPSLATRPDATQDQQARSEAGRIITTARLQAQPSPATDQDRLAVLSATASGLTSQAAHARISSLDADVRATAAAATDHARRVARDASLWLAAAMLFGALVAMLSAVVARLEDDRDAITGTFTSRTPRAAVE